jgi:hypothetical protein
MELLDLLSLCEDVLVEVCGPSKGMHACPVTTSIRAGSEHAVEPWYKAQYVGTLSCPPPCIPVSLSLLLFTILLTPLLTLLFTLQVLQYHTPPQRRLPPLVFVRLRDAFGDYMTLRGSNGANVVRCWDAVMVCDGVMV